MKKISFLTLFFVVNISISFGYFENKYYCVLSGENIQITLNKNGNKCLDYIGALNKKISSLENEIKQVNYYIQYSDEPKYWEDIKIELISKKNKLETFKTNIIEYMQNFEKMLFLKIKKLIGYYYQKKYGLLNSQLEDINKGISLSISNGDIEKFNVLIKQKEQIILQMNILNQIISSQDFDGLIPFLKHYIKNSKN